jgi:CubicO group peptidase (beta-lactamase class C family)
LSGEEEAGSEEADDEAAISTTRRLFAGLGPEDPGCTVAVGRDGELVWAEAFGAAELSPLRPMTTETVVDIGSTSKQFTATAVALLSQRGQVDLDAPVSRYVPQLPAWGDEVTVLQMVHHTSGIPDYIDLLQDEGVEFSDVSNDEDALEVLGEATELDFDPGARFEYSNSNYFLLGQVVLRVTGADLGVFLEREVFGPLGMRAVMDPTATIPGKAKSYTKEDGRWVSADSRWTQLGDGAVQTTPTELVKWASQYWAPTVGGADINALRFEDAPDEGDGDSRYGFGISERVEGGTRFLEHDGGWGGFLTAFVVVPSERLVITGTCTGEEEGFPEGFPEEALDAFLGR